MEFKKDRNSSIQISGNGEVYSIHYPEGAKFLPRLRRDHTIPGWDDPKWIAPIPSARIEVKRVGAIAYYDKELYVGSISEYSHGRGISSSSAAWTTSEEEAVQLVKTWADQYRAEDGWEILDYSPSFFWAVNESLDKEVEISYEGVKHASTLENRGLYAP